MSDYELRKYIKITFLCPHIDLCMCRYVAAADSFMCWKGNKVHHSLPPTVHCYYAYQISVTILSRADVMHKHQHFQWDRTQGSCLACSCRRRPFSAAGKYLTTEYLYHESMPEKLLSEEGVFKHFKLWPDLSEIWLEPPSFYRCACIKVFPGRPRNVISPAHPRSASMPPPQGGDQDASQPDAQTTLIGSQAARDSYEHNLITSAKPTISPRSIVQTLSGLVAHALFLLYGNQFSHKPTVSTHLVLASWREMNNSCVQIG